jgi:hypothetical protein
MSPVLVSMAGALDDAANAEALDVSEALVPSRGRRSEATPDAWEGAPPAARVRAGEDGRGVGSPAMHRVLLAVGLGVLGYGGATLPRSALRRRRAESSRAASSRAEPSRVEPRRTEASSIGV